MQMAEQQDRPLWEVMIAAGLQGTGLNGRVEDGEAARLRAIADVVAPEEETPGFNLGQSLAWQRWAERQRIRALLLAEAERAEKGEANG
jgi:hypothetical protein